MVSLWRASRTRPEKETGALEGGDGFDDGLEGRDAVQGDLAPGHAGPGPAAPTRPRMLTERMLPERELEIWPVKVARVEGSLPARGQHRRHGLEGDGRAETAPVAP